MSSLHRFFLTDQELITDRTIDLGMISHQLQVVLRLQPGAQIVLLDGGGRAFLAQIISLERKAATGRVLVELPQPPEAPIPVTLYQCTLKADKFEWVLQKATELGIARFVPVISQRSVVRPAATILKKYDRWQAIIREAAEQCGRGRIPDLAPPLDWEVAIQDAHGLRLLPWEEQTTGLPTIKDAITASQSTSSLTPHSGVPPGPPTPRSISLLIGPEGGIGGDEAAAAQTAGWQPVNLGPRILRAETAAITSTVLVMTHLGAF